MLSSPSPAADAAPAIDAIVRQLNQSLEFERIVNLVARHASELLGARVAAVLTLDGDDLVVVGSHGPQMHPTGTRLPGPRAFANVAVTERRAVRTAAVDAARWPYLAIAVSDADRPNALAAPLCIGGRSIGAVCVCGRADGDFDGGDEQLLTELADHAAVAVENARLYSAAARMAHHNASLVEALEIRTAELAQLVEEQRRERELAETSAEIARLALGATDTRAAATAILGVVARVVPCATMALAVRVDDGATLEYVAATSEVPDPYGLVGIRVPFERSLARHLTAGEPVYMDDVRAATDEAHRTLAPPLGALLVPLVARQQLIGVLAAALPLGTTHPPALHDSLRRLAAHVALALDALLMREEERRRVERERTLAAALATMDQPVFVLAPDERVRYANPAAEREYGYPADELVGLPADRLVAAVQTMPDGQWLGGSAGLDASGPAIDGDGDGGGGGGAPLHVVHHVHRRKDGSEFPAAVTLGTIRDADGQPVGQVLGVRDLTDERRLAEHLRQHEKLAALGSLVAGVAHELNNPLTGISAFSQLLLEDRLEAEQLESVRLIKREADRAVGVIRDLLLFSRKSEARLCAVDLNALLQLTVRLRTYTLRAEDVTVELALDPDVPPVQGDEQRLQQVLLNLIVNAEYALHGRPERRLTLQTRRTTRHVVVEVADSGVGIDAETQRHIFEPFFTTKPAGVGTGLGLSVSYGIVQAHGGTISVDSQPGRGATFRLTFPIPAGASAPASVSTLELP